MNLKSIVFSILVLIFFTTISLGQKIEVPSVYSNIGNDEKGIFLNYGGNKLYSEPSLLRFKPSNFTNIVGTVNGLRFDFQEPRVFGIIYYGFIPFDDSKFPQPVFFGKSAAIVAGKVEVPIKDMADEFDMIGWRTNRKGTLGYRVVTQNTMVFDGKINFDADDFVETFNVFREGSYGAKIAEVTKPFKVTNSIIEGPLLANLTDSSVTIFYKTNFNMGTTIKVDKKKYRSKKSTCHEVVIEDLIPNTEYSYSLLYGDFEETYSFRTAPAPGSRSSFTFSYASDSRSGNGGGERNLGGTNAYILKRIMALNQQMGIRFMQFSGDLITGYLRDPESIRLEYMNWKQAVSPYGRYFPVVAAMGNHEALIKNFKDSVTGYFFEVDNFPFEDVSSEAIFQQEFVNPLNGPESEDGASYDPDPEEMDFPSYKESVFYYTYDNVAMVVLNSNYWYAPTYDQVKITSGNIHGYVMDNQMEWLKTTLGTLEEDDNIDHVFVTIHTPFFPNGGHINDDMWYKGNNEYRPVVAGKAVAKGIIERRDELLDIIVNQNTKVKALLTGDEHNYARTLLNGNTPLYPPTYDKDKISLSRPIWQINNGAAGAPYYAQGQTPWSGSVERFSTQNALVFFHVNGTQLNMEVFNPETLEIVDEIDFE